MHPGRSLAASTGPWELRGPGGHAGDAGRTSIAGATSAEQDSW